MFMNIFYPTVFTDTRQFSSIKVITTQKSKGKGRSLHLAQKTLIRVTADRDMAIAFSVLAQEITF